MSNANFAYPFDPEGTLPSNKILAENNILAPAGLSEFLFIVPQAAPFFASTLKVVHLPSQRTLTEGVDYIPTHYFHDASLQCAAGIYGSITFYDNQLTGAVRLTYQTLGGDWTLDSAKIIDILSNKLTNPRRVVWEQIVDLPYAFPPIDHDWHLDDMVGMSEVVEVLEQIRDAMLASGEQGLQNHLNDKNNPHEVTKAQVQLGNVDNYPTATIAEAQGGAVNNRFMTPLRTKQLMDALFGNLLNTHIGRSDNPHNVTKEQIGLNNVQNFPIATIPQAQAGILDTVYLTPASGRALVETLAMSAINTHIARKDNPHEVTKAQVNLGNVMNYPVADVVEARAGIANDRYMTPAMTREAITAIAMTGISDHIDRTDNPHGVTKAQVNLGNVDNFLTATQAEAEAGLAANRFLTVLRGKQMVEALINVPFQAHLNDDNNPHGVTKAQVNLGNVDNFNTATIAQAEAGLAGNLFLTPAGARALFVALGGGGTGGGSAELQAHLEDLANPHEVTKDQVNLGNVDNFLTASILEATAGTAKNLFMTPAGTTALINQLVGNLLAQHIARQDNPHGVTAAQVGAYTTAQTDTLLNDKLGKTEKAADSTKLDGKTYEEVIANAKSVEVYPAVNNATGDYSWTLLGKMTLPTNMATNPVPDIVGIITGGETPFFAISSSFKVRLALRNLPLSQVEVMNENYTRDVSFGYVYENVSGVQTVSLYLRGPATRYPITAAAVSHSTKFFVSTDTVVSVEPTDIRYLTIGLPAFARQRTSLGDLSFGDLPVNRSIEQTSGQIVEWVSVATTDAEELEVQAVENSLREDYGNYTPWSGSGQNYLYDDLDVLDKWGWNSTEDGILLDTATVPSNAMLSGTEYGTDYSFEVEISSTHTDSFGAGVIAAQTTIADRYVAISVVRTPGGLTQVEGQPSSFEYKLKSVALHINQSDGADLGGGNGMLKWADTNAADEDRDPADFVPAGHGWDTAGKVRIRVTRAGNVLTIDVSDFGDTSYPATEQVVLNFETDAELAQFKDRPTTWGLISVKQPNVTFKVLSRPRRYRDYVRIGVAADNDKQRYYRFNGSTWTMSYLGLANTLVRPNRLYYSDWNGVMYHSQRNGRLRPIMIEAYSRANPTLLTT